MTDEIQKLRIDVERHDAILRGDPATGKGGLVPLAENTGVAVFGTPNQPGLIAEVRSIKRVIWMCTGALFVLEIVLKIFPTLLSMLKP